MDFSQVMLSTIKGEPTEILPFVPRLDLWYKANKRNGTLPDKYRNAALMEISDDLGIGYHAAVPDFRDYNDEEGDSDLGLGIYRFKTVPCKVRLHNVKQRISRENDLTTVEYDTPSEWKLYIEKDCFDLGQPDASYVGGFGQFMKIAQLFEGKNRRIATHSWSGGAGFMQNIHAAFACPNTAIVEIAPAYGPLIARSSETVSL